MRNDFLVAIEREEVKEYLRGDAPYRKFSKCDFYIAYEPTETSVVIKEIFETEKEIKGAVKVFFSTLNEMISESAVNTYLVFDYLESLIYEDNNGCIFLNKYEDEVKIIKTKLGKYINYYRYELEREIIFPNGWNQVNAWEDIKNRSDDDLKSILEVEMKRSMI